MSEILSKKIVCACRGYSVDDLLLFFHGSRGLQTLTKQNNKNASFREHLRRSHQYWWVWSTPVAVNQGSKSSGTGPGPLEAINDPVSCLVAVASMFRASRGPSFYCSHVSWGWTAAEWSIVNASLRKHSITAHQGLIRLSRTLVPHGSLILEHSVLFWQTSLVITCDFRWLTSIPNPRKWLAMSFPGFVLLVRHHRHHRHHPSSDAWILNMRVWGL